MGIIEAGATDFWVPRGYVHVIANLRGTGGSGDTFGLLDGQERQDLHDLVEWVAAPPWCDGNAGMIGEYGLTWPWESLHVEALAWFDHWLKGQATGILDGPPIRYVLPGADGWRTADVWPPAAVLSEWALRADGTLGPDEGEPGNRRYMTLGAGLGRVKPSRPTRPPC